MRGPPGCTFFHNYSTFFHNSTKWTPVHLPRCRSASATLSDGWHATVQQARDDLCRPTTLIHFCARQIHAVSIPSMCIMMYMCDPKMPVLHLICHKPLPRPVYCYLLRLMCCQRCHRYLVSHGSSTRSVPLYMY